MTTTDPLTAFGTKKTHQQNRVPGRTDQVKNNAGGYVFEANPIDRLIRFLTIGTAGGSYYVGENDLTRENGELVIEWTKDLGDHKYMVDLIVDISLAGRAKKQNPTLFALAIACQMGSTEGKQYARKQINKVVRTGTHLFIFVGYLKQFGGWSRGLRKAVGNWYVEKESDKLAYQLVKYRQRAGYTHRDILRLTHPTIEGPASRSVINWAVRGDLQDSETGAPVPNIIHAHELIKIHPEETARVLGEISLPWEALPDSAMNDPKVWDKMLDNGVPTGALLRQLSRLTNLGLVTQMGGRTDEIIAQLLDPEALRKSRIHPFAVLIALKTYARGHGVRSSWTPATKMIDALDEMYYASFGNVVPTGKRTMNALDLSASMTWSENTYDKLAMNAREIAAAMSMMTVRTEPNMMTTGFTSPYYGGDGIDVLPISARQRLDDVVKTIGEQPAGPTDCSLPMLYAQKNQLEIDTFVIYTDNETWSGGIQPFQALKEYRSASGIDSKLVVVACTPTKFSIADPSDKGMLDVSGFDSAVPQLISDFSAGNI
jgi:60 kDa SS-A/Ro ribonucleoprotein